MINTLHRHLHLMDLVMLEYVEKVCAKKYLTNTYTYR